MSSSQMDTHLMYAESSIELTSMYEKRPVEVEAAPREHWEYQVERSKGTPEDQPCMPVM